MSRKLKVIISIVVLIPIVTYLISSYNTLLLSRVLSVNEFVVRVNEGKVTEGQIVIRGKVDGESIKFDKSKSELRFDLISDDGRNKIHVLLKTKVSLNLKDGETVDIEGLYMVEKVFIAHKVTKT